MSDNPGAERPVALITGGGTGVGAATAVTLAKRGYDLCLGYRTSAGGAEATAEGCRALGARVITVYADVTLDPDCRELVNRVIAQFGRLDALVNIAGATVPVAMKDLEGASPDHFLQMTAVNVLGPFQLTRAAAPHLAASKGAVVNVSSLSGQSGIGSSIAYAVSKGALNTLTLALARVLAPVRVNAVVPGVIDTQWMIRTVGRDAYERTKARVGARAALGGVCPPEDIAEAIAWLLHAKSVTGELVRIDAGQTLGRLP